MLMKTRFIKVEKVEIVINRQVLLTFIKIAGFSNLPLNENVIMMAVIKELLTKHFGILQRHMGAESTAHRRIQYQALSRRIASVPELLKIWQLYYRSYV